MEDIFSQYRRLDTWEEKRNFMDSLRKSDMRFEQQFAVLNKTYWKEYWAREEDIENGFCPDCHQRLSNNGAPHTCIYF